jgi:hypothetical protein
MESTTILLVTMQVRHYLLLHIAWAAGVRALLAVESRNATTSYIIVRR